MEANLVRVAKGPGAGVSIGGGEVGELRARPVVDVEEGGGGGLFGGAGGPGGSHPTWVMLAAPRAEEG